MIPDTEGEPSERPSGGLDETLRRFLASLDGDSDHGNPLPTTDPFGENDPDPTGGDKGKGRQPENVSQLDTEQDKEPEQDAGSGGSSDGIVDMDPNVIFTEEQLLVAIHWDRSVRKRYTNHFWKSTGHIRTKHYPLIFRENEKGELLLPHHVISDLVPKWEAAYDHQRYPDEVTRHGGSRLRAVPTYDATRDQEGKFVATKGTPEHESRRLKRTVKDKMVLNALAQGLYDVEGQEEAEGQGTVHPKGDPTMEEQYKATLERLAMERGRYAKRISGMKVRTDAEKLELSHRIKELENQTRTMQRALVTAWNVATELQEQVVTLEEQLAQRPQAIIATPYEVEEPGSEEETGLGLDDEDP
ncbi:hypothetical protein ABHI18_012338 [Aspergillus niger]